MTSRLRSGQSRQRISGSVDYRSDTASLAPGDAAAADLAASLREDDAVIFAATRPLSSSRDIAGLMEADLTDASLVGASLGLSPVNAMLAE